MDARETVIGQVAENIAAREPGHPLRVGVDGVVGAGKTTFAAELVAALRARGRPAVDLDSDGFHNPRSVRYRRGRDSARGYYDDAYDFAALADRVLRPLGSGPPFEFATAVHDLASDELVTGATAVAEPDSIVVFDCTFLQRGSLRGLWDAVVWLDCDRAAALRRGVVRDAAALGGEEAAAAAYESRYMAACELYLEQERPFDHASIVVDNTVPLSPRLVRL